MEQPLRRRVIVPNLPSGHHHYELHTYFFIFLAQILFVRLLKLRLFWHERSHLLNQLFIALTRVGKADLRRDSYHRQKLSFVGSEQRLLNNVSSLIQFFLLGNSLLGDEINSFVYIDQSWWAFSFSVFMVLDRKVVFCIFWLVGPILLPPLFSLDDWFFWVGAVLSLLARHDCLENGIRVGKEWWGVVGVNCGDGKNWLFWVNEDRFV